MSRQKAFRFVFITFIVWRVFLLLITYFGISVIPLNEPLTSQLSRVSFHTQYWSRWAQWDGGHFIGIAFNGYLPIQAVFLPLFPLSIKLLAFSGITVFWAGFILAQLFALGAFFYFYKLVSKEFNEDIADNALFAMLVFPTAFYFGAIYSEGLFILLAVLSFYFLNRKNYFASALFAGLSSITRLVGIGVILGIFMEYFIKPNLKFHIKYFSKSILRRIFLYSLVIEVLLSLLSNITSLRGTIFLGLIASVSEIVYFIFLFSMFLCLLEFLFKWIDYKKIFRKEFFILLLSFIPLGGYGVFEYFTFGSPFALLTGESYWNRHFTLPWDTPLSYFQALIGRGGLNLLSGELLLELSVFCVFLGVFLYSLNKLKVGYIVFYFFALLLPLFSGTLVAIHRYYLIIFPFFMAVSLTKNMYIKRFALLISVSLLGLLSIMYINGYWVT